MAVKPKTASTPSKGGSNTSQSYLLLLFGILALSGVWVYGIVGLCFGIIGWRFATKNSKAATSSVGQVGKVFSIIGTFISIIYLIVWAIVLLF